MPENYCNQHQDMVKYQGQMMTDIAVIKNILESDQRKIETHIDDGEKPGGYRDRIIHIEIENGSLKKEISVIKSGYWKTCIVSGIIGGMLGKLTPEVINFLFKTAFAGQ